MEILWKNRNTKGAESYCNRLLLDFLDTKFILVNMVNVRDKLQTKVWEDKTSITKELIKWIKFYEVQCIWMNELQTDVGAAGSFSFPKNCSVRP